MLGGAPSGATPENFSNPSIETARRRLAPCVLQFRAVTMTAKTSAFLTAAASLLGGAALAADCPSTTLEDRMPGVIAPMAGAEPVWLVDGSFGRWLGASSLVKSVWVVSREYEGDLVVEGRRLDGSGQLRFVARPEATATERATITDAHLRRMLPGDAADETTEQYAFASMYLIYPSPGCWQISVRLGEHEVQIVVHQTADPVATVGQNR